MIESQTNAVQTRSKIGRPLDTALKVYILLLTKPWLSHNPKDIVKELKITSDSANSALKRVRRNWVKMSKLCLNCYQYSLIADGDRFVCQCCGVEPEHIKSLAQLDKELSAPRLNSLPSEYELQYLTTLRREGVFRIKQTVNVLLKRRNPVEEKIKSVIAEFSKDRALSDDKTESVAMIALKYARDNSCCYTSHNKLMLVHNSVTYALLQHPWGIQVLNRFLEIWTMLMVLVKRQTKKNKWRKKVW